MSSDPSVLSHRALEALDLPPQILSVLRKIQAEVADAYRDNFIAMLETQKRQASQLDRIQATLQVLVQHMAPTLRESAPAAFRIASADDASDLASAVVVSDPIGMGFLLSQADVAAALQLPQPYVSTLIRAFGLDEDEECAVVVRRGHKQRLVNYHKRVIDKFRALIADPPANLKPKPAETARLARRRLGLEE